MKGERKEQADRGLSITWDAEGMITLHGTVFGIEATREEICLLFGVRTVRTGRCEEAVAVSDRIILSPLTAKRLMLVLEKIMARHELQFVTDGGDPLRSLLETSN